MKTIDIRIHSKFISDFSELLQKISSTDKTANLIFYCREFAKKINSEFNTQIGGSLIYSFSIYVKIIDSVFEYYLQNRNKHLLKKAFDFSLNNFGTKNFISLLDNFVKTFPPEEIYKKKFSVEEYIWLRKNGRYSYEYEVAETILFFILNRNKALEKLRFMFDIETTQLKDDFEKYINIMESFISDEPPITEDKSLIEFLLEPIRLFPDNLEQQLEFIKSHWKEFIDEKFINEILIAKDFFKEDIPKNNLPGIPETIVPQYKFDDLKQNIHLSDERKEYLEETIAEENFTPDTDWMPNVIMIAKNTYVWLDQLSKKYNRKISKLDEIPDEELETLSDYNINALWLIGIWERSEASRKIKHLRGNTEAVASAYSLYDYEIAKDLGGEKAYKILNRKAMRYGIRLAADMVPNHTGIHSKWIEEHPDFFIQSEQSPFPNYKFTGENLSPNPNFTIRIEDGYWTNSDAAVVFQWIDNRTGKMRFIYHGNDGTSMPWNDTAQLDILKADVREAVIQKILYVARKFSIIRFDAAMTLTKKHFARLWYPEPGHGGDIPSRASFSLTKEKFNEFFPKEFWREVVDRINNELPDTLLLAEAFWLMEGYFVRTLGMHRVYNSAFMNMLMREENSKYRELIKNTLEFDPGILKRYVNFMSNPDEETAIKQFGTGDKYFGVLTLMITLPGLPMFAHGQIEGFGEKYGMEYKRAYYNEEPNLELVERHKREIFPLAAKRRLFSEVDNFWFFDFIEGETTNENVFAYVNKLGNERALVFYNNKYSRANGKIYISTQKLVNTSLERISLIEALQLPYADDTLITFRDEISKKEFVFKSKDFKEGFNIALNGFEYRVFSDFRIITENIEVYENLYSSLAKQGVNSLEEEKQKLSLKPLHDAVYNIFEDSSIDILVEYFDYEGIAKEELLNKKLKFLINKFKYLINYATFYVKSKIEIDDVSEELEKTFSALQILRKDLILEMFEFDKTLHESLLLFFEHNYRTNLIILILMFIKKAFLKIENEIDESNFIEKIVFPQICADVIKHTGKSENEVAELKNLIDILIYYSQSKNKLFTFSEQNNISEFFENLFENMSVKNFLKFNVYKNTAYFRKENFEELLDWFFTIDVITQYVIFINKENTLEERTEFLKFILPKIKKLKITAEDSGFKLKKFLTLLKKNE